MILKTEKNANYTTLCNIALNDPELSLKAKGLFAFLMSKPTDWTISYRGLMTQLKEGQWSILKALKELEDTGYLQRDLEQNSDGQLYITSVLREQPVRGKLTHGATAVKTVRRKPTHGKPTRGKLTPIVKTEKLSTDKEKLNKKVGAAGIADNRGKGSPVATRLRELIKEHGPAEASRLYQAEKKAVRDFKALESTQNVEMGKDPDIAQKPVRGHSAASTQAQMLVSYSGRTSDAQDSSMVRGGVMGDTA